MVTSMIHAVLAATVRHRHAILVIGALVALGNAAAVGLAPHLGQLLFFPLLAVVLTIMALAIPSWQQTRPAILIVQPQTPAFGTPAPVWPVYVTLCCLAPFSAQVGALIRSSRHGDLGILDTVLDVPWLLLVTLLLAQAWRGHGAQLRPDGIHQSYVLGSLTVPWEALPIGTPDPPTGRPSTLRLAYAEPHLVRRRGMPLSRHALRTDNVDAGFLAATIHYYVCHPEHRAAIGTQQEYRRLLSAVPVRHNAAQQNDNR
jgi:hypothetical protein